MMDDPKHAAEVLKGDAEVDGYVVCLQGLGWRNDVFKLCTTGKPTLLVDNLFGGSGLFLTQIAADHGFRQAGRLGQFVERSGHCRLGASASRCLRQGQERGRSRGGLCRGRAASARPQDTDWTCKDDPVEARDLGEALERSRSG